MASGMLVIPVALKETLAQAIPGFVSGGSSSGIAAKLASLPLAAKLVGAAATVAVVGVTGSVAVHDRTPLPTGPAVAKAATRSPAEKASVRHPVGPSCGGVAVTRVREEEDERDGPNQRGDEQEAGANEEGAEGEVEETRDAEERGEANDSESGSGETGGLGDSDDSGAGQSSGDG